MRSAAIARPIVASERDQKAVGAIAHVLDTAKRGKAQLLGPDGRRTIIPQPVYEILHQAVRQLQLGNGITILPTAAELTTQQAADILQVSRPFLVKLLEEARIPFHKIGSHRRIYLRDVLRYKSARDEASKEALAQLVAEAQDLGLYDE